MKLLVTGGAGYVGSVVATQLSEAGHQVHVIDSLVTGHRHCVPAAATFSQGDITDPAFVKSVVTSELDAVVHLAALSLVSDSVGEPAPYWHTNVIGTLHLLNAMRAANVRRLVFSSTASTYGLPRVSPITESTPTRPTNPYGASKLAVDHIITSFAQAYDLGAYSLRYFNVAGSYRGLGERHEPETHLIPNALFAARDRHVPLTIFGTDWPTPDGTAIRDFIHVADLAKAHLLALDAIASGHHEIANLGSGRGHSVREVISAVERVTGRSVTVRYTKRRPGDPAVLVASNKRARQKLDWHPTFSLEDMVSSAWEIIDR